MGWRSSDFSKNLNSSNEDWVRPVSHFIGPMVPMMEEQRELLVSNGTAAQQLRDVQQTLDEESYVAVGGYRIDYSNRPES